AHVRPCLDLSLAFCLVFLTRCASAGQNPNVFSVTILMTGHAMRTTFSITLILTAAVLMAVPALGQPSPAQGAQSQAAGAAQSTAKPLPKDTEVWDPVPPIVTPGATNSAPPSDATILFDGSNLDQWVSVKDKSPAGWKVADGVMTVVKSAGNIETKRSFR